VTRSLDLQNMVGDAPVGSTATLTVNRGGQTLTLNARLTELPTEDAAAKPNLQPNAPEDNEGATAPSLYGMRLSPLSPRLTQRFGLTSTRGAVVVAVEPDSPAADAGIMPGDVVERVGQTAVNNPADVRSAATKILGGQTGAEKTIGFFISRPASAAMPAMRRFFFVQPTN